MCFKLGICDFAAQEGEPPQYKNEVDCFRQLVTREGPASLYDGLLAQLVGIAPEKVQTPPFF